MLIAMVALSAAFSACTYRSINPDAALADERANNGYQDLQEREPGVVKLVVRSSGSGYPAHFSISTSPQACQGLSPLGNVVYAGRGIVYPWIANAVQGSRRAFGKAEPYRVYLTSPGEPVQVRGYGLWADGTGAGYRSGTCGPVVVSFTPQEGRAYVAEFIWGSKPACQLIVLDATNPDVPVVQPTQVVEGCPPPPL